MRVFRVWYKDRHNQRKQVKKWWIQLRDHLNTIRRFPAFTDRSQSEALGRQIGRLVNYKIAGEQLDPQLSRWLEQIPQKLRDRFVKIGLLDAKKAAAGILLQEHVEDYRKSLSAKGRTEKYIAGITSALARIFTDCKFVLWSDILASRLECYLDDRRDGGNGISARTFNFNLKAVKQFCNWMIKNGRASQSPVACLECLNTETDKRHPRRALEPDEIRRLLEAAAAAPRRFGMAGHARVLLYRLAIETGLRASELRSLTISSFDFDNCTVTVEAAYSKHRRQDILPLKPETTAELKCFIAGTIPGVKAFNMPSKDRVVKMIKADLADAGIDYIDDAGRYADFHSLRHTTGSLLAASGVHPKVAQSIMRHADINLTMSLYTHTLKGQESAAVKSLPDFSLPSKEKRQAVAMGTNNDGKNLAQNLAFFDGKPRTSTDFDGQDPENQVYSEKLGKTPFRSKTKVFTPKKQASKKILGNSVTAARLTLHQV
ncbi:MAG: site-specific integrase [Planctomycetes bacterium]|nr:site-specific integrase [Planctomycetota bacterium]